MYLMIFLCMDCSVFEHVEIYTVHKHFFMGPFLFNLEHKDVCELTLLMALDSWSLKQVVPRGIHCSVG